MGIEKRKKPRMILRRQVVLNKVISAMGLDLSEGGIYIHTGRHFPAGNMIDVSLPLDGGTLNVAARVQHSKAGVGMGLMFINMTPEQQEVLSSFIKKHEHEAVGQARKKVLILAENVTTMQVYRSRIVLEGFTVFEAADRSAALDLIDREQVDLVLMDLNQRGANGFEVLCEIRARPGMESAPILVLSTASSVNDVEHAIKAGATEFMPRTTTSPVKLGERLKLYLKN
ncbi:MAG: response regulator [Nitrospiraceae bacterium]|nr:response regulator [Nitrospiraceae bacterium]